MVKSNACKEAGKDEKQTSFDATWSSFSQSARRRVYFGGKTALSILWGR